MPAIEQHRRLTSVHTRKTTCGDQVPVPPEPVLERRSCDQTRRWRPGHPMLFLPARIRRLSYSAPRMVSENGWIPRRLAGTALSRYIRGDRYTCGPFRCTCGRSLWLGLPNSYLLSVASRHRWKTANLPRYLRSSCGSGPCSSSSVYPLERLSRLHEYCPA